MPGNRLLKSLPSDVKSAIDADLEMVQLQRGDVLYEQGSVMHSVYFPVDSLISLVVTLRNGSSIEAITTGNDGFLGIPLLLGSPTSDQSAIVQIPGEALRTDVVVFLKRLSDERLRKALAGYANWSFSAMTQTAACFAFHAVAERLARWLLTVRDAMQRDEFPLTQEFMSVMLGTHRPTVTIAIRTLEEARLIEHRRGVIRITDGDGLEDAACECYRTLRELWRQVSA